MQTLVSSNVVERNRTLTKSAFDHILQLETNDNTILGSLTESIELLPQYNITFNTLFNVTLRELSLIPEFFLAFAAVTIITHSSLMAYGKTYSRILLQFSVTSLCILIILLTLLLYLHEGSITLKHLSLEFSFLKDSLGFFSKTITILASFLSMYILQDYIIENRVNSTEYDLLMLYAILGLIMLIGANDFATIFLVLELQSLSLYMLSGFKSNSIYSIESGLKYFILGALSAAYFLLGWSLLYGISGLFILLNFHFFFFNIFLDITENSGSTEYTATDKKTHLRKRNCTSINLEQLLFISSIVNTNTEEESSVPSETRTKFTSKDSLLITKNFSNNAEIELFNIKKDVFIKKLALVSGAIEKNYNVLGGGKETEIKTKEIFYNKKFTDTNELKLAESSLTLILVSFFF